MLVPKVLPQRGTAM